MKIILVVLSLIVAYFLIKRNKKTKEKPENIDNMIICSNCGFHVLESAICITKEQINKCPNKK